MNTTERTSPAPRRTVRPLNPTLASIRRNGFWFTLPPLIFSIVLMAILPNSLTAAEFNMGVPSALLVAENTLRILTFALPLFFSISLSGRRQQWGLRVYLLGIGLYFLSYGTQNFFPGSAWSMSFIGFMGSAFLNVFWMIGLGLMGDKFNFGIVKAYRPVYYSIPIILFIAFHSAHAALYYQLNLQRL
jgi:hypothetical protein